MFDAARNELLRRRCLSLRIYIDHYGTDWLKELVAFGRPFEELNTIELLERVTFLQEIVARIDL